jgi:uncharacterized membrane protein
MSDAHQDGTTATVVRARRPPDAPLARLNFRERIAPSLWYTPGLFVVGAVIASKLTVAIDRSRHSARAPSWLLGADSDAAASLTSMVSSAMLSFVAVVFTTTLVAIQLAGGQYSPRVVRIFVRSRLTHVTMGVFLATFVFALNALVEIRSGDEPLVPAITVSMVYVSIAATLGAFITFVHGMSRLLRVQYLYAKVTADGRPAVLAGFPPPSPTDVEITPPTGAPGPVLRNTKRVGVVQAIDSGSLVAAAEQRGVVLEVLVEVGEYVGVGTPIARVLEGAPDALTGDEVAARFLFGAERTLVQDPGFVFRQLVDVAIRALSPAVNDPTTGVQAIDRINDLLGGVAGRPDPTGWYVDERGAPRLLLHEPGLERLLLLAYVEIIRYGADSPQVARRLHAAFDVIEPQLRPDVTWVVHDLRRMLTESEAVAPAAFAAVSSVADRHGLG